VQQYFQYLGQIFRGDLGLSFTFFPTPVGEVIGDSLPWTLALVGITTVLAFLIGTGLGVLAGWRRGSWTDLLLPVTTFLSSIPYFWLGLLAITLLAGPDSFFPSSGGYEPGLVPSWNGEFIGSAVQHSLLPAITILISSVSGWILTMRNNMVTTLAEDYVRMARAKGIPNRRIMFGYAGRNAFLPNLSGFAMSLGFVISGTILVEYVFNYPGLGYMFYNATVSTDYPLLQALFLLVTLAVLICVLLCDFAVFLLDPRAIGINGATVTVDGGLTSTFDFQSSAVGSSGGARSAGL
jgi:peptide/nickel transport system permease protein